jgi:hypothetical protein
MPERKQPEIKSYFGGLPTGPEVKKLEEAFPEMEKRRGTTILHEDIEAVLRLPRTESRYKTVVNAWRSKVRREHGIDIRGDLPEVIGVGYRVLAHVEQAQFGNTRTRWGTRQIGRAQVSMAYVDQSVLPADVKRQLEHDQMVVAKLRTAYLESRRFVPRLISGKDDQDAS